MKAKVIIENGQTTISLTPENEFEIDIIEKVRCKKGNYNLQTTIDAEYNYGAYRKHSIDVLIKEERP